MEIEPQIFNAKVMHNRLFPKVNGFNYGIYYLALPLSQLANKITTTNLVVNHFGVVSFFEEDYGAKDGSNLDKWIRNILKEHCLECVVDEVMLISMPRILGYSFNPVSFWLCLDNKKNIRVVLCEVNNTFGETHSYLCSHEKGKIIKSDDSIEAKKLFHVSPFLKREGHYKFRFSLKERKLAIWIDFYNEEGKKQLVTSLIGNLTPLTKSNLRKSIWRHPLVTLKTIFLIHWQALKLIAKGVKYISKPTQMKEKLSRNENIKKM